MSRAAFFDALTSDVALNALGINQDSVFPNYTAEERPSNNTPFIILRWSGNDRIMWQTVKPPEHLTLWVHWPAEVTNDYTKLIAILDAIDKAVVNWRDLVGEDGYTLSFVEIGSRSSDFLDQGFNTLSKNANYDIFRRETVDA